MGKRHLFIIDPIEKLKPQLDSSLRIAYCLHDQGDQVFFVAAKDLMWNSTATSPSAYATQVVYHGHPEQFETSDYQSIPMDTFQVIHMRLEPPFDISYLAITWLLQECARKSNILIINQPQALQSLNEKMAILKFPQYIQPTLVTQNVSSILQFWRDHQQPALILKPLDLFGGKGILKTDDNLTDSQLTDLLTTEVAGKGVRLVQKFDSRIYDGEIRVFTLNGQAIQWCLKKPPKGSYLANTSSGATLEDFEPNHQISEMVQAVATKLTQWGVYLAGFDIIGNSISEINITSPRLLSKHPDLKPYMRIAEWIKHWKN